jgi:hypothetical protein
VHAFAFEVATVARIWRDFQRQSAKRWRWLCPIFAIVDECDRFVIDISQRGISNEGQAPRAV